MYILRDYQINAVNSIFTYFYKNPNGNPVIAMPTGSGKSLVIAEFCNIVLAKWNHVNILVLTHVKELVSQNANKLKKMNPELPISIYSSGLDRKETRSNIIFANIQSIFKIADKLKKIDIILIDEAHMLSNKEESMYIGLINILKKVNANLRVIGFTATPYRATVGLITNDGIFTDICFDITNRFNFNNLIEKGYLCNLITKKTQLSYDLSNVPKSIGDYKEKELQQICNVDITTLSALTEVLKYAYGRKSWLVFCTGIEHTINVNRCLIQLGIKSTLVHSKMKNIDRDSNILNFKKGKYTAICNNGILTTGIDIEQIDLIIMLRPTMSIVLWIQMIGRGLRIYEGKSNCLVLDFAKNTERLGPINDPVIPKKKGDKPGDVPIKICPNCQVYNYIVVKECIACGFIFPKNSNLTKLASSLDVIKNSEDNLEEFLVHDVYYFLHKKKDKPNCLRCVYRCGISKYEEYVHIERSGYLNIKAKIWWKNRLNLPFPTTVTEALKYVQYLKKPKSIIVNTSEKYPSIVSVNF